MPRVDYYKNPTGDRKLEFWKTFRGGHKEEFVNVPSTWDDHDIEHELEDWCAFHMHNSDYMRYGWNDEKDFGSRV